MVERYRLRRYFRVQMKLLTKKITLFLFVFIHHQNGTRAIIITYSIYYTSSSVFYTSISTGNLRCYYNNTRAAPKITHLIFDPLAVFTILDTRVTLGVCQSLNSRAIKCLDPESRT